MRRLESTLLLSDLSSRDAELQVDDPASVTLEELLIAAFVAVDGVNVFDWSSDFFAFLLRLSLFVYATSYEAFVRVLFLVAFFNGVLSECGFTV